jgi:hypothetical protein
MYWVCAGSSVFLEVESEMVNCMKDINQDVLYCHQYWGGQDWIEVEAEL